MEGLPAGRILQPWSPGWKDKFIHESIILRKILGDEILEIHHIGGTSNPHIPYSKPILDILVVVDNITRIDDYAGRFRKFGYYARGENGIIGRRYFVKGVTQRTHHVHIFEEGDDHIDDMLTLNQYLLHHPDRAAAFGAVKRELADRYSHHVRLYEREKGPHILRLLQEAKDWAGKRE